jgi:flagellar hook-associated protein 1 FlgK
MSDLLSIAASGVRAYQTALTTVSENIAGVGVEGYSRRTVSLAEVASTGRTSGTNGVGVRVAGISRATDEPGQVGARSATSDLSKTRSSIQWLDKIESSLTGDRLSERVTSFFASARALTAEPGSPALRAGMVGAATSAAIAFSATGRAIDRSTAELDEGAARAAGDLSALGATMVKVNMGLGQVRPGSSAAAELTDQRDRLLRQMSELTDVSASFDSLGRVTVQAGGRTGPTLVSADKAGVVSYERSGGAVSLSVKFAGVESALTPTGGALAGVVDGAQRLDSARTSLNAMAADFATAVNTTQTAGEDLNGAPGEPIFAIGDPATELEVVMEDPAGIAAASPLGGSRDGSNLDRLEAARVAGGFEKAATEMVTENAAVLQQRNTVAEAQTAIREGAITSLSTRTGVDLDNEAVELMRFQQAYQASSRVIQVARDTFQSILEVR